MFGRGLQGQDALRLTGESVEGNPALAQVRERGYAGKYRGECVKTVHEVGLVFSRATRNLIQADWV